MLIYQLDQSTNKDSFFFFWTNVGSFDGEKNISGNH